MLSVFKGAVPVAACVISAGCVSFSPFDFGGSAQAPVPTAAEQIDTVIKAKGAAIIARVAFEKKACAASQARLRRVVGGKLDLENHVAVEQITPEANQSPVAALTRRLSPGTTVTFNTSENEAETNEYLKANPLSFTQIEPGTYVVTWLKCDHGNGSNIQLGADIPGREDESRSFIGPIPGANSIVIEKDQLIDSGLLNIVVNAPKPDAPDVKTGRAQAIATPKEHRDIVRTDLPELFKRLKFITFTAYRGKLANSG
ncbi:MAG: hypothetical protein LBR29_00915 [Methylobacteriaceae bacterium]|jgi:hypothetical protein|nr:hypothetical protein [Methylobacteriaceae bacterium]